MKRRQLIKSIVSFSIGATVAPSLLMGKSYNKSSYIYLDTSNVDNYVSSFANAIGLQYESYSLKNFLKENYFTCNLEDNIKVQNKNLKRLGYKDFFDVYSNCGTVMYSAERQFKKAWNTDTILMVYNKCNGQFRTKLDEGAIIGISQSATKIFRESGSHNETYKHIAPFINMQDFAGSLYRGYNRPLRYKSSLVEVEVDIVKKFGGNRMIKVIGSKGYNRIIDNEFNLNIG